ncbi:SNF2 family N-terminal domain-containing protein [Phellopilus nigrolimitatus]|nr:SNF2 family N-terminal domain-containing protein [Phellopilus nigrolimitatus]
MSAAHMLEYSKSSRAKCNGPLPCKGSNIELGVLRYGQVSFGDFGEVVKWRHWGCVTPAILQNLAVLDLERIPGFRGLRPSDQAKIRQAIARKRVDPTDVPESAKSSSITQPTQTSSPVKTQKKRKADSLAGPSSSQTRVPSSSQSVNDGGTITQGNVIEIDDNDEEYSEEEPKDELYCMMSSQVVGVQYYKGLVGPGEEVTLTREPLNRYDRNAIQVKNIAGAQVGHIPRTIAAKLAPLLDRRLISVEGIIHDGNLTGHAYSISMTLKIYGASDQRNQLEPLLIWATPRQRGFPPSRADGSRDIPGSTQAPRTYNASGPSTSQSSAAPTPSQAINQRGMTAEQKRKLQVQQVAQADAMRKAAELKTMLNNLEKVDDESRRTSLLDTLCSTEDVLNLPVHPCPPGIATGDLVVDLLKHQSQALQWCIDREYPKLPKKETDKPVQFWLFKKNGNKSYYYNLATKSPQEQVPMLGRGALCADSMGLGKTLTMLALILATKSDIPPDYSRSTLIVVPLSVLSNWEGQIKEHCHRDAIEFYVYYGSARSITPEQMKKYDIIITTYQVVTQEHADSGSVARSAMNSSQGPSKKQKKNTRGVFDVQWKRVILDEGHNIRNPRTKGAKAVCGLSAQRRWVVTGTPIINSPRDLGSILSFLKICKPLDSEDFFKRLLLRPLKDGMPEGYQLLKALMNQICIRRTKEMQDSEGNPLVPLPGVEMITIPVQLDPKARELYDDIEGLSQQRFQNYMDAHGGITVPTNVLSMLTRLRQIVLHPGLVPSDYREQMQESNNEDQPGHIVKITPQNKVRLQAILAQMIEDSEECPICFSILDEPRITGCAHAFCLACITEVILRDPKCPMDRREINLANLIEPPPPTELTQAPPPRDEDDEDDEMRIGSSAKINQLVHLLQLTPGNEKSLVFSQFTSFLDKIAEEFERVGISYARFDGKMSAKRRQETLERFCIPVQDDQYSFQSFSQRPQPSPVPVSSLGRRSNASSNKIILDSDDDEDDEKDREFVSNGNDDDDDFLEDDDSVWVKKGKGKDKGKGKAKNTQTKKSLGYSAFDGINPKVMLISLKAGALGLNLTVANNVYLMDPWWQEGIESQAIDRCNRIGQKRKVHVYQLIAENTVESKVIDIQEKKKKLINQAFSGIKSAESQRQKKEARMQDLIELFGVRQHEATQSRIQTTLDNHVHTA